MSLFAGLKSEIDVKASVKDQSGRAIKTEFREDEESKEKLQHIIDLLLAAGYFRARISTLPNFDKVVGGLVWCISTCNVDLDVDLLYQENSTIGQKIALTEKIVAVLPRMKCPHELQPHQIQGLDCIKIFPVVQWLVKKAMERKEEMAQYIRSFSETQFNKEYTLPSDAAREVKVEQALVALERFMAKQKPTRVYKKPKGSRKLDLKTQTQSTLLEYGNLSSILESANAGEDTEETAGSADPAQAQEAQDAKKQLDESRVRDLLKTMSSVPVVGLKPNMTSVIGALLQTKGEEISQVVTGYEEKQAVINEDVNKRETLLSSHERVMRSLNSQISGLKETLVQHSRTMGQMKETYSQVTTETAELDNKIEIATERIQEIENAHNENMNISAAEREEVEALVSQYDTVVREKETFTRECKEAVKSFRETMCGLKEKITVMEQDKRTRLVDEQYNKDKAKLDKLRLQVAKKNYSIAALQRKVDDIPSRIELLQYQKRFEELHVQTSMVHKETKQFYSLYNNLSDTKTYLEKHLIRLNSINENFLKTIGNLESSIIFLEQFEKLVEGAKISKTGIEKRRDEAKLNKDKLNDEYLKLVEEGRRYYSIVKEFQDECKKTEMLVAKCKEMGVHL